MSNVFISIIIVTIFMAGLLITKAIVGFEHTVIIGLSLLMTHAIMTEKEV
jgi:hypothetical protein